MTPPRNMPEPEYGSFGISEEDFGAYQYIERHKNDHEGVGILLLSTLGGTIACGGTAFIGGMFVFGIVVGDPYIGGAIGAGAGLLIALIVNSGPNSPSATRKRLMNSLSDEKIARCQRYKEAYEKHAADLQRHRRASGEFWTSLDGHAFEAEFAKTLIAQGYQASVTKGSGDGGIDIVASISGREIWIQCKAWSKTVGPGPVRELAGVREGNVEAWLVSLGGYTEGAIDFAARKDIKLLDLDDVIRLDQRSH